MTKLWSEVVVSPEYRALKPDDREAARAQYWNEVIAPQVPKESLEAARAQFETEFGPDGTQLPKVAGPERSRLEGAGRAIGLTARHALAGIAAVPAMASDAITGVINTGADALLGKGNGFRFQPAGQALQDTLSAAGLPAPETKGERVVGDVTSAITGVGTTAKAGELLARAANPLIAAVGLGLGSGLAAQTVGGAAGAAAAGTVRENGGGVGAQMAAGLAAGLAPSALPTGARMAARGLLRGGEAGRQRVEQNIKLFEEAAGTTPSLAQATEGRFARGLESTLSKAPGSSGIMARFAERQADDMQAAVQRLSDELAPGANATSAGEAIERGIGAFKAGFKSAQSELYDELGAVLPKEVPITVDRTRQALAAMNEGIEGAPALSRWFRNAKIGNIEKALISDLELAATPPGQSSVMPQAPRPAALPFEAIKKLRTLVGNEITDGSLVSDVPRSKWRALYGALSEDLGDAAKAAGPQAEAAWKRTNDFTSQHMQRLDELASIVRRDAPEKIFTAALSGANEGATVVKRVMSALPAEEKREVAAAVLQRMGRANPGQQTAEGDAFSSERFLTAFSKMSPAARQAIFGDTEGGVDGAIKLLAQLAEARRAGGRVLENNSGTATAAAHMGAAGALVGGVGSALTGSALPLATVALPMATANATARVMTNPRTLRLAATRTAIPEGMGANAAMSAARLSAPTDLAPEQREIGTVYETPRGRMIWRGNGWEPAP